MEAFSLLKYWRGGSTTVSAAPSAVNGGATTIVTAVSSPQESDDENNDNGPFFDLEFSVPAETRSEESSPVCPLDELQTGSEPEPGLHSKAKFATNFRVLMLKLKKNKENDKEKETDSKTTAKPDNIGNNGKSKFFTIKLKIEEIPIKSVFKRENSSKSCAGTKNKPQCDENGTKDKRFSKDAMQRYLKMVSKRYSERMRFSEEVEAEKGLGKSRSVEEVAKGRRRDDSLVQQEDGIQSAILHCKKSFNSTPDSEMSILSRSISDPSHDHHKSLNTVKKCSEEFKENGL